MELKDAANRSSEVGKSVNIGNFESESRLLGGFSSPSSEFGSYQIGASRKNSEQGNTLAAGEPSSHGIFGKITSQLITETEKQLAYYEQQAELLRQRLKELKQLSEASAEEIKTKESE